MKDRITFDRVFPWNIAKSLKERAIPMAFHVDCYEKAKGKAPKTSTPSKYESTCAFASDGKCLHGGKIKVGDAISWARRGYYAGAKAAEAEAEVEETKADVEAKAEDYKSNGTDPVTRALAAILLPLVEDRINDKLGKLNPDELILKADELIARKVAELSVPREIVVKPIDGEAKNVGHQHCQFEQLLNRVRARVDSWIAGPAGTGKSTAAEKVAEALGLGFFLMGVGELNDPGKLLGYTDVHGKLVRTPFREAWEHGGMLCLDDVDRTEDSRALCALNGALANGYCAFPDRVVKRHENCVIVATANTWGEGATAEYVGAARLDKAFLDRFVPLAWKNDDELEKSFAGEHTGWYTRVVKVRAAVAAKGLRHMITPRATVYGARMLTAGIGWDEVEQSCLRRGMTEDQWASVK